MKISYNWLKDYLDIDIAAEKIAQILTDIGLEVEKSESFQNIKGGLNGLVVGYVEEAWQHPNADRLKLTKVNLGNGQPLQIVCGAPNVAAGQKVVVATSGTTIYPLEGEPFTIAKRKVRGEESNGMICAEDEIGLGTDHDGIIVLPENAEIGQPAKNLFEIYDDIVWEIGLTPNRSDATCHIGVAKDLLAALKQNKMVEADKVVVTPDFSKFMVVNKEFPIEIDIQDAEACPRYSGVSIAGIEIKESPDWLKNKLEAIGVRPINNIVDITNFVLHEMGQPLHAFDLDEIEGGKVVVKKLAKGSKFVTLDEIERELSDKDLMICNAKSPMCIAGVFGGIKSGVKDSTTNIFLESACFEAIGLRKTSQHHNLRTDAAMRFEKGVDPNISIDALKRAALLITELAGGRIASSIVDFYPKKIEKQEVTVRYAQVNRLAGIEIPKETVDEILANLEMKWNKKSPLETVITVPTNKVDVLREVDVIEEILRIYGYNNIPIPTTVVGALSYEGESDRNFKLKNVASNFLTDRGYSEMMNNSITQSAYNEKSYPEKNTVAILNSLTSELDTLRKNMFFSGLESIAYNQNRKNFNLKLYEFGTTYEIGKEDDFVENENLSIFVTGSKTEDSWNANAEKVSFYDLKKIINNLVKRIDLDEIKASELENDAFSFGMTYKINGRKIVDFGMLKPALSKDFDVDGEVYTAVFNWNVVERSLRDKKSIFTPLPKYPSIKRDVALVLNKSVDFGEIESISKKIGKKLLVDTNLFDVYMDDDKLGKEKKSYAVSFTFLDDTKTLTKKEVDKIMSKMIYQFEQNLGAIQK